MSHRLRDSLLRRCKRAEHGVAVLVDSRQATVIVRDHRPRDRPRRDLEEEGSTQALVSR
jgi:hypothetical protein